MKRGPENESVRELVVFLEKSARKNDAPIWKAVARRISSPRRRRAEVNVGKIARIAKKGSTILVAGKVLGAGEIGIKVDVASLSAARGAREKLAKAGGRLMSLEELVAANPKGSGVVIVE